MRLQSIENHKKTLQLTRFQKSLLVGKLLGDGHLETANKGKTYRLKIEHALKQKEYVDWLYAQFPGWANKAPARRLKTGFGKEFESYGFTTYSHSAFRFYGQQFYNSLGEKHIPKMIGKLLDPIAIAIWYLDDGSFKSEKHRTFIIHSHGYPKAELEKILSALKKFGIQARLHRQRRGDNIYWRIYVLSESADIFRSYLEHIVQYLPSMRYKLGTTCLKSNGEAYKVG